MPHKVVFHHPDIIDADFVGIFDLLDDVVHMRVSIPLVGQIGR